ncbi:MAG TPA: peroxidase family protein [Gemmataceae bacterium]|jgi:hypothetical protein
MYRTTRNRPTNRKPNATQQRRCRPCLEPLEDRCLLSASPTDFRPITEVGNNVANPTLATAVTDLLRLSPVAYADGISAPSLPNNPSARVISDIVNNQADTAGNDIATIDGNSLSDFGYSFGQFMDHDMDLTPTDAEMFNIAADPNDPSGMATQTFFRSVFDQSTGTSTPRQQVNAVTSYLDLSNVYGSTQVVADALRTGQGGLLKTSDNGLLLPLDNNTYFTDAQIAALNMANDSQLVPESQLFAAGDVRANENMELTALQTLFVRNHNMIATELAQQDPTKFGFTSWTDENLYQEARKLNIAEYQNIIYTQYLPDLLGPAAPKYTGYNSNINPSISTEFSTVAFRFGHSMLSGNIERQDNNGNDITGDPTGDPSINLAQDFFDPTVINTNGSIDPVSGHITSDISAFLKGNADGVAQATDVLAINEVRNLLFANGQAPADNGQDLIARDIQRARDDGIGTYNQVRQAFGLAPVTSFAQITSNVTLQQELQDAYGSVDNIDPFEGGLAEDHVPGSDMGPLFTRILSDQFSRLENGDRYFYLNEKFTPAEKQIMNQGSTLGQIIENNTDITNLQPDVFKFTASISGTVSTANHGGNTSNGNGFGQGLAGITVELEDTNGDVLATTTTDKHGNYTFTQQSGPSANPEIASGVSATGDYQIVLVLPQKLQQVGPNPGTIHISRGGINVTGVNFRVTFDSHSFGSGPSSATPAVTSTTTSASPAIATVTSSSAAASADPTQTATLATALADSSGSGTGATPQASAPAGQASGAGSTSSVSNPNTVVFVAKHGKASHPLTGAASDAQDLSD